MAVEVDATRTLEASAPTGAVRMAELAPGERVGRYVVRRLLGSGGMGRVYLARDLTLGRSVALKVVDGTGSSTVLDEARATARLNHPHIVQLFDVGLHGAAPYLALEYLEGESLRDRIRRERPSVDETQRIMRAVAAALAHAHDMGVHHCDLKPANIMLPNDGRLRVVDFGLARLSSDARQRRAGTPDWMAPEQWRGDTVTDKVDVWALGVLLHVLVTGEHPFGAAADAERRRASLLDSTAPPSALGRAVAPALVELAERSLLRDPALRPTARDWLWVLDDLLARGVVAPEDGPYRGLSAFDESHATLFFGREAELDAYLERLRGCAVLPIAGPSGAGKSSFLHAGVIPRLRAREPWRVIALRPGARPFAALARVLLDAPGDDEIVRLAQDLRATPTLLGLRLATMSTTSGMKILLAVDQLEEVFTQGAAAEEAADFVAALVRASDDPRDPIRIAFTVRDDFIGLIPELQNLFVLRPLGASELARAVTGPLDRTGFRFEDASLVEQMLGEIRSVQANLPLLQFACRALWDLRDDDRGLLTRAAYNEIGGALGALARHADQVVSELSGADRAIARHLLLQLVTSTTSRRTLARRDLAHTRDEARVLERLLGARFLVQRAVDGADDACVELAHESLLTTWAQLRTWIDESSEERRLLRELHDAADAWTRRGQRPDETWPESELLATRTRLGHFGIHPPERIEAFLVAGEQRVARGRRRARVRIAAILVVAFAVTAGSVAIARRFREERIAAELANGNLGWSELALHPFDRHGDRDIPIDAAHLPDLRWSLYLPAQGDPDRPGAPIPASLVRTRLLERDGAAVVRLEAPGGPAFLRIDGRGQQGDACGPSWVRIQALPGYASRAAAPVRLEIPVPTCQASRDGTVSIPAGDFIYGGPGEPPTRESAYVQPEQIVSVPDYAIDLTEVSNGEFHAFAGISTITGYPVPTYPQNAMQTHAADPDMPVAAIDAREAEAYCRYMGKRLPSDVEWTKAARGGLQLANGPNPLPRRLYPWGATFDARCVNGDGQADGFAWTAPVRALGCGASPYGVLNLAGNVAEWISRRGQMDPQNPLRVVRGGAFDSPAELEQTTTIFRNAREARQFDLAIGVRCAAPAVLPAKEGSWDD